MNTPPSTSKSDGSWNISVANTSGESSLSLPSLLSPPPSVQTHVIEARRADKTKTPTEDRRRKPHGRKRTCVTSTQGPNAITYEKTQLANHLQPRYAVNITRVKLLYLIPGTWYLVNVRRALPSTVSKPTEKYQQKNAYPYVLHLRGQGGENHPIT